MNAIAAIILAAGKGTRMKSDLPKVLHKVCGHPMIKHVVTAINKAGVEKSIVVIGHGAELVKDYLGDQVLYAIQAEQLGTGHAVMQTTGLLHDFQGTLLVLCGDTPLITAETLKDLMAWHKKSDAAVTVMTANMSDPSGYGRIIRNEKGNIEKIIEQKDATTDELEIKETNTGAYCFDCQKLFAALKEIKPVNAQGEYYITDVLAIFNQRGFIAQGLIIKDYQEMMGINNRIQLAEAEKVLRLKVLNKLMLAGVTIIDPESTYIHSEVQIAADTVIYPQTYIEGNSVIGSNCFIGPMSRLVDVNIGDNVQVQNSVILESKIGFGSSIGPFAYLRPGTEIGENAKVGDFVEIKKSIIGNGSKVPHLTYIGDSLIGEKVNIGAGTITCNYDGKNKWLTTINDGAFIGSNTNLVAPVKVGSNAVIAAGSTITKDVPAEALGVARNKQSNFEGWSKTKK